MKMGKTWVPSLREEVSEGRVKLEERENNGWSRAFGGEEAGESTAWMRGLPLTS